LSINAFLLDSSSPDACSFTIIYVYVVTSDDVILDTGGVEILGLRYMSCAVGLPINGVDPFSESSLSSFY